MPKERPLKLRLRSERTQTEPIPTEPIERRRTLVWRELLSMMRNPVDVAGKQAPVWGAAISLAVVLNGAGGASPRRAAVADVSLPLRPPAPAPRVASAPTARAPPAAALLPRPHALLRGAGVLHGAGVLEPRPRGRRDPQPGQRALPPHPVPAADGAVGRVWLPGGLFPGRWDGDSLQRAAGRLPARLPARPLACLRACGAQGILSALFAPANTPQTATRERAPPTPSRLSILVCT